MKVVHVIKRVEMIDNDIKELRKLEKSLSRDKSFSTPIYMTIEKQINILLGDRIKLLDLRIANPPESFISEMKDDAPESEGDILPSISEPKKTVKKAKAKPQTKAQAKAAPRIDIPDIDDIPMLTQDQIDSRFDSIRDAKETRTEMKSAPKAETEKEDARQNYEDKEHTSYDDNVKLLDIALEKGSLNKKTPDKEKKIKFFRENFPST
ncbi:MAG: hypothetical protein WDA74_07345 [Spirochaetota bacterium]